MRDGKARWKMIWRVSKCYAWACPQVQAEDHLILLGALNLACQSAADEGCPLDRWPSDVRAALASVDPILAELEGSDPLLVTKVKVLAANHATYRPVTRYATRHR